MACCWYSDAGFDPTNLTYGMMKKQKYHEHDDPATTRPMKCVACNECKEIQDSRGRWTGRCIYDGPFTGFVVDPEYNADVAQG